MSEPRCGYALTNGRPCRLHRSSSVHRPCNEAHDPLNDCHAFVGQPWDAEVCKRCNRRNVIGFTVPDEIWSAVVRDRWNVLCPTCFDEEAQAANVRYSFSQLWPVTWQEAV